MVLLAEIIVRSEEYGKGGGSLACGGTIDFYIVALDLIEVCGGFKNYTEPWGCMGSANLAEGDWNQIR